MLWGIRRRKNWNGMLTATIAEAVSSSYASPFPRRSHEAPIDSPIARELMKATQGLRNFFALDTVRSIKAQPLGAASVWGRKARG
jgi:hypothetical protein